MLTQAATIIHPARQCISIWRRDSNSGVAITRRLGLNACALGEPSRLQCLVHGWLFIGNQTHPSHVQVGQGPGSLNAAACRRRGMLTSQLERIAGLDAQIERLDQEVARRLHPSVLDTHYIVRVIQPSLGIGHLNRFSQNRIVQKNPRATRFREKSRLTAWPRRTSMTGITQS